jgi:hypothetical protein
MLPLPSRTHPKNKTWVVYTEELTHLAQTNSVLLFRTWPRSGPGVLAVHP